MTGAEFIPLNGVRHWVRQAGKSPGDGSEPPLVVLHDGPGGHSYVFEHSQGPFLEREFRLVYYDRRGCGRSDPPAHPLDASLALLVDDLEALRAALGFKRIVPLGLGFGGRLAVEYALAYPERVDGLILDTPPLAEDWRLASEQAAGFLQIAEGAPKAAIEQISRGPAGPQDRLQQLWAAADPVTRQAFLFYDPDAAQRYRRLEQESGLPAPTNLAPPSLPTLLDDLPRLGRLPTLMVCGWYDRNVGLEACRDAVLRLARGELGVFHNSAHFPYLEETKAYFHTLRGWVESNVLFNDFRRSIHNDRNFQRQLQMVWPAARQDDPPRQAIPDGYTLSAFQAGDERGQAQGFYDLMELAGFGSWDEGSIQPWLRRIVPGGWLCARHTASGQVAASALALHDGTNEHPFGGELGWVAAHPDHRGRGLGGLVSAAVTARLLQAGYRDVHLYTEDYRLAAIRTYLKLGYVPFWNRYGAPSGGDEPQMLDRWRALCQQVNWPYTPNQWIEAWPQAAAPG